MSETSTEGGQRMPICYRWHHHPNPQRTESLLTISSPWIIMQFRRNGHRDERRRRVLIDEMRGANASGRRASSPNAGGEGLEDRALYSCTGYASAAQDNEQPPVTCLIPKRPWTLTVCVLSGLTLIAAVEFLYTTVYEMASASRQTLLTALDVEAAGSLMGWLSSAFLLLAAATSIMVYAIRRHRLDDYRGRYRIWHWAAFGCLLASIDAATGLHQVLATSLAELARTPLYGDGAVWWLMVFAAVFGLGALRFSIEVRRCLPALFFLVLACTGYVAAGLMEMGLLLAEWSLLVPLVQSACVLLAHLSVTLTVVFYCRRVYRDAQTERLEDMPDRDDGVAEEPPKARSKRRRDGNVVRFDSPHDKPAGATIHREDVPDFEDMLDDELEDDSTGRPKPSKAERRKARKQARRKRAS